MELITTKSKILNQISTDNYQICLLESGVIEISWKENIQEITVEMLKELKSCILDFGGGKKMPVFISTINFLNITSEARKYAASKTGQEFTLANAVLIDNLGKKMMFNFFMKINKPYTPTKAFRTREDAFQWLSSLPN
jgi:hypothetical protein